VYLQTQHQNANGVQNLKYCIRVVENRLNEHAQRSPHHLKDLGRETRFFYKNSNYTIERTDVYLITCDGINLVYPLTGAVWKTWLIFQNFTFRQMSKKINKINFPYVYSVSMG